MSDADVRLLSTYGACPVCGAPRDVVTTVETREGITIEHGELLCTADRSHSQEPTDE